MLTRILYPVEIELLSLVELGQYPVAETRTARLTEENQLLFPVFWAEYQHGYSLFFEFCCHANSVHLSLAGRMRYCNSGWDQCPHKPRQLLWLRPRSLPVHYRYALLSHCFHSFQVVYGADGCKFFRQLQRFRRRC